MKSKDLFEDCLNKANPITKYEVNNSIDNMNKNRKRLTYYYGEVLIKNIKTKSIIRILIAVGKCKKDITNYVRCSKNRYIKNECKFSRNTKVSYIIKRSKINK